MSEESDNLKDLAKKTSPVDKQTFLSYLMSMNVKYWSSEAAYSGNASLENPLLFNPRTARLADSSFSAPKIRNGYNHFALVDSAEPAKVINRLNKSTNTEHFLKIPNSTASSLRHYVRLYEIIGDSTNVLNGDRFLVPVPFPTNAYGSTQAKDPRTGQKIGVKESAYGVMGATARAASDHGLQEISLDFQATNPAEINNNIICKIKIFFNSIRGLTQRQVLDLPPGFHGFDTQDDETLFDPDKWNFMRLLTRSKVHSSKAKLVIGFDPASILALEKHQEMPRRDAHSLQRFLLHETLSLTLSLKEHEIDVNENGSVVLTITYHGGISSDLNDLEKSDILGLNSIFDKGRDANWDPSKGDYIRYIDRRLAEIRASKSSKKNDQGVGPSSVQPPLDSDKMPPDYTREYLDVANFKYQKDLLGNPKKGTRLAVREWIESDPALAEERSLLRARNIHLYQAQQQLGVSFFDYLIGEGLIRNLYVPVEAFHKTLQTDFKDRGVLQDTCGDFRKVLPFISMQTDNSEWKKYQEENRLETMSPNDKPERVIYKLRKGSEKVPPAHKLAENAEKEIAGELLMTTFEYGRHGKNETLQKHNKETTELSQKLFSAQKIPTDPTGVGRITDTDVKSKRLRAALKIARGNKEDLEQESLLRIQYVFLGDILEGILAYHASTVMNNIGDEKGNIIGSYFALDMQKHLILNTFELNHHGKCSDKDNSYTRARWKVVDGGVGKPGPITDAESKKTGVVETTIERAKVRSIADIPIAIETLNGWWIANVVKKLRTRWSMGDFLNSVMTQLVPAGLALNGTPNTFNSNPSRSQIPSINIFEASLNAKSLFGTKFKHDKGGSYNRSIAVENYFAGVLESQQERLNDEQSRAAVIRDSDLELILKASAPSVYKPYRREPQGHFESKGITDDAVSLMILSLLPLQRSDLLGDETSDSEAGVWHFRLARDGGPVLSYNFSRNDIPYLSEANVFSATEELTEDSSSGISYNISLKMLGNQLLQPGSTFFIDLLGLGFGSTTNPNSAAYKLNIGGYYIVKSVKSHFGIEGYFTEVEAVWQKTALND